VPKVKYEVGGIENLWLPFTQTVINIQKSIIKHLKYLQKMKKIPLIIALLVSIISFATAQANKNEIYVQGYSKSNGTHVEGHWRTAPNNTINDNYGTYPNVNPHTGKVGTIRPDYSMPTYPSYRNSGYSNSSYKDNLPSYPKPSSYNSSSNSYKTYSTPSYYNVPTYKTYKYYR
jgi:hypothetical protein